MTQVLSGQAGQMDGQETVRTRAAGIDQPDEIQQAQNRFAVAVKNWTETPNPETQKEMDAAQTALQDLEDLYREGRKIRLAIAWGKKIRRTA